MLVFAAGFRGGATATRGSPRLSSPGKSRLEVAGRPRYPSPGGKPGARNGPLLSWTEKPTISKVAKEQEAAMQTKLRQLDQRRETRKGCKNSTGSFRVGKSEQGVVERQRSNSGEFVPGQAFAERQRSNSGEFVAGQAFAERQRSNSSGESVPGQTFEQAAICNMREFEKPRSEPWQFVPVPAQQHTNLPRSRRPCRILCFGDSNTAGFTDQGRSYYPYGETLSETLRAGGAVCDVGVCGLNGHSAKQMAAAMGESCVVDGYGRRGKGLARILDDDGPIDLVIIMTGTNDLARGAHAFDISNVTTILHRACHERGVPTIALAPPFGVTLQRGHQQVQMRKQFAELLAKQLEAKDGLLAFFDAEELVPHLGEYWSDAIHFSAKGHRMLGRSLAEWLLPVLQTVKLTDGVPITPRSDADAVPVA